MLPSFADLILYRLSLRRHVPAGILSKYAGLMLSSHYLQKLPPAFPGASDLDRVSRSGFEEIGIRISQCKSPWRILRNIDCVAIHVALRERKALTLPVADASERISLL